MKKITLVILMLFVLAVASPVNAAREFPTVGDRIGVFFDGEQDFPAGTPFHVRHGFLIDFGNSHAVGLFDFNLEIDGEPVGNSLRYIQPNHGEETGSVQRIYNFPQGMPAGTYTFVGRWYQPCDPDLDPEGCPVPNQPVLTRTSTVIITFTP